MLRLSNVSWIRTVSFQDCISNSTIRYSRWQPSLKIKKSLIDNYSFIFNCITMSSFTTYAVSTLDLNYSVNMVYGCGVECHFQQYFSYVVAVSFIGEGNQSTWRKPQTCHKLLTNFIT